MDVLVQFRAVFCEKQALAETLVKKSSFRNSSKRKGLAGQKPFDPLFVGLVNHRRADEVVVLPRRMFAVHVAHVCVAALDFARAGERKTLLRTGVGFHLWHNKMIFMNEFLKKFAKVFHFGRKQGVRQKFQTLVIIILSRTGRAWCADGKSCPFLF